MHAGAGARQPPMLHVAFGELPRDGVEDLSTRQFRPVHEEGQRILQLVAEVEGAACLVEGGARHDPATEALIGQPGVDQVVEGLVRASTLIVPVKPSQKERPRR